MSQPGVAWIEGQIVPLDDARVPLMDRGYLLGDGVFETLRVDGGRPFRAAAHARRFHDGLAAIGLPTDADFEGAVTALVEAGRPILGEDFMLRIEGSGGPLRDIPGGDAVVVTGSARPARPRPAAADKGLAVIIAGRKDTRDPWVTAKTLSFLPHIATLRAAKRAGADDALLTNEHGRICEATTSNIFARVADRIHAPGPEEGAVPGITRDVLLEELAGRTVLATLDQATLRDADEVWITNTSGGAMGVTSIDGRPVGNGQVGALTRELQAAYEARIRAGA